MTDSRNPPHDRPVSDTPSPSPGLLRIADTVLWVAAVGFALALAYFAFVPAQRLARVSSVVFWYVAPALVVSLSVWALRSAGERRIAAALLLVSAIGSAFAAEAVLRAMPQKISGISITKAAADSVCPGEWHRQAGCLAAAALGEPFDRRTTLEVIRDLEAQGMEAWPSVEATHYMAAENAIEVEDRVVVPLSPGVPNALTVFCNEAGDWITYESDEYGFNNPSGSHRPGEVGTVVVGDSFVHGWCVPYEQTLVGRLRERDSTTIGLGIEGSGPLVQLGVVREYVAPLHPSVVVWVFFEGNDLRDFSLELSDDLLPRYLDPGFRQGLREMMPVLDRKLRNQISRLRSEETDRVEQAMKQPVSAPRRRESLAGWIRLTELRSRLSDLGRSRVLAQPYDPARFEQVVSRMRDDVAAWGGTLLFAYMPSQRRFADRSAANPHRDSILAQVERLGVPVIDLYETLAGHPDPLSLFPFRVESHLTGEGYDLAARALGDEIEEHRGERTE